MRFIVYSPLRAAMSALALIALAAIAITVIPGGSSQRRGAARRASNGGCPGGFIREREGGEKDQHRKPPCQPIGHPESYADLAKANSQLATRKFAPGTELKSGAYEHALAQRRALAQKNAIEGDDGLWTAYGPGPMIANNKDYDQTNGSTSEGFVNLAGRTNDFARDDSGNVYAAVAFGGVWKSSDGGAHWTSIGDNLPTQVTASVDWSPANGGTLIVLTGDHAFGGSSVAGLGVYRTTDGGKTWQHASGPPSDVLGFQVKVDPTNPNVVYAATGNGLWRSTDAGASFTNVDLPTGCKVDCFLANMVTDVVIQGLPNSKTTGTGARPGAVMAAVGWRGGPHPNVNGNPQSPRNGIYTSSSGEPGSFKKVDTAASGFAGGAQADIGRVELGIANGPQQNHKIVYALVQDAGKFNGDDPDELDDVPTTVTGGTVFRGLYVTQDFGATWTLLENSTELTGDPAAGSALEPAGKALGYEPGIQAWYNEFVEPDPTRATATGVPSRLFFGLEEIWQSDTGALQQDNGVDDQTDSFHVIGRYWNSCAFLVNGLPKCGPGQDAGQTDPNTTTTHPDQQGALLLPAANGALTLIAGNDGGVYSQTAAKGAEFDNNKWGEGANGGFNTMLPYDAQMAKDGTVYAGLQDNGQMKIQPDGKSYEIFGGDAFFSPVDPDNSKVAYEEYTNGAVQVTTDGGKNWTDINPSLTSALFSTPLVMDPADAKHLMIGGREIKETDKGPNTTAVGNTPDSNQWKTVFDLGTQKHRGVAAAQAAATDPNNQMSAVDVRGDSAYVGFCGYCDTITQPVTATTPFDSGIATNVGGDKPGKRMTSDGWHIAKADGLPRRYITSVAIEPDNPSTVYATVAGYSRRWARPGAVGDDTSRIGKGHVFRSTDAGQTFTDISADLPDVPANWVVVRSGKLVVGTDIGAFISESTGGGKWAVLGGGLPNVPVFRLQLKPGDPDTLVAATYGRGVYTYKFPKPGTAGPANCADTEAPLTTLTRKGVKASRRKIRISGTSRDLGCDGEVRTVYVSLALVQGRRGCRFVDKKGRVAKRKASCRRPKLLTARGTTRWSITIPAGRLPRGRLYRVVARGVDATKHKEKPAKKRNQVLFRLRG